jgi:hypothetical protein
VQANGFTIATTVDNAGSGNTFLISGSDGSACSAVSMSMATSDAVAFKTNAAPVTFSFTSARVLPAGQHITITLPASFFVGRETPAVMIVNVNAVNGVVAPNATCALVTAPQCVIICTTAERALEAAAHRLVFGAGQLSTGAARAVQANGFTIATTVDSVFAGSLPAIVIHSLVFQNEFDLFAHKRTSGSVNISFFNHVPLPAGGRITIHLPTGFFSGTIQPVAYVICAGDAPVVACSLFAASINCTTSVKILGNGPITLMFLPATLTTGVSRSETTDLFKIETSVDVSTAASVTPAIAPGRVRNHAPLTYILCYL